MTVRKTTANFFWLTSSTQSFLFCFFFFCFFASFLQKIILIKCSPSWAELWGIESLQSSTPTGPPARGSSNALLFQCLYIRGKQHHLLHCGSISSILTRRSLVLVLSLFWSSATVSLHFYSLSKFGICVEFVLFSLYVNSKLFKAWIFWQRSI